MENVDTQARPFLAQSMSVMSVISVEGEGGT